MEDDAMRFVKGLHEAADLAPHHALEGNAFRRDDVDGDIARAQGCRHLQSNEAGAHDDHALCLREALDDGPAVSERPKIKDARIVCAGNRQTDRLRARREQQGVELPARSVAQHNRPGCGINRRDARSDR